MRVAITGATGLVGQALLRDLIADGHEVVAITRTPDRLDAAALVGEAGGEDLVSVAGWKAPANEAGDLGQLYTSALAGCDVVVHLAGESIAGRWTRRRRGLISSSRAGSATLLMNTISMIGQSTPELRPNHYIGASAVGYYGNRGDEELTEASPPGDDFLARVCVDWEAAADLAPDELAGLDSLGISHARLGLVLAHSSAATRRLMRITRLGLGGPLGRGRQWWSWITLVDAVRALRYLIEKQMPGPINLCAPEPSRQKECAKTLAKSMGRPAFMPAPAVAVRLALGEMGRALLLDSTRVLPAKLTGAGFEFEHPTLVDATNWLTKANP